MTGTRATLHQHSVRENRAPEAGRSTPEGEKRRLLLLTTTTGYQTRAFVQAAEKLGLAVAFGSDRCHVLDDPWQDGALALKFGDAGESAAKIIEYAARQPVDAVVALGDSTPPAAARAADALGLLFHPPETSDICRDKYRSRQRLAECGLSVPRFNRFPIDADPEDIVKSGIAPIGFPCVLKPLAFSASRGVIRANNAREFINAFKQIQSLLRCPEVQVKHAETSNYLQVEEYIEGEEIAIEGVVDRGRLKVLAMFDKPDPLVGPYFEESIYVTPSRLALETQAETTETLRRAAQALGLVHGPLHAELRINGRGTWILEVAARSIGGLCSRALRFRTPGQDENISLEELIIRLAIGENVETYRREEAAAGVMMIPIPRAGIFQEVEGVENARQTPGVEDIIITARPNQRLVPIPEGTSYPGFIFARGPSPEFVEHALRQAHQRLHFVLGPVFPVI
ncbi:MAG: ATP-grasp domain-containing protein [Acidobacteria bacterium]|nr:MAG: ATP-grasp domain-containing protein [Acidobacteriota bacterium]